MQFLWFPLHPNRHLQPYHPLEKSMHNLQVQLALQSKISTSLRERQDQPPHTGHMKRFFQEF